MIPALVFHRPIKSRRVVARPHCHVLVLIRKVELHCVGFLEVAAQGHVEPNRFADCSLVDEIALPIVGGVRNCWEKWAPPVLCELYAGVRFSHEAASVIICFPKVAFSFFANSICVFYY